MPNTPCQTWLINSYIYNLKLKKTIVIEFYAIDLRIGVYTNIKSTYQVPLIHI